MAFTFPGFSGTSRYTGVPSARVCGFCVAVMFLYSSQLAQKLVLLFYRTAKFCCVLSFLDVYSEKWGWQRMGRNNPKLPLVVRWVVSSCRECQSSLMFMLFVFFSDIFSAKICTAIRLQNKISASFRRFFFRRLTLKVYCTSVRAIFSFWKLTESS